MAFECSNHWRVGEDQSQIMEGCFANENYRWLFETYLKPLASKTGFLYFWWPAVNWGSHNPPLRFNKFLELLTKHGEILPFTDLLYIIQLGSNPIEERHGDKPEPEQSIYAHPRPGNSIRKPTQKPPDTALCFYYHVHEVSLSTWDWLS